MIGRLHINNSITICPSNISIRAGEYILLEVVNEYNETILFPAAGYVLAWFYLVPKVSIPQRVTSISCLCHDLIWSIFSFVLMWNLVLKVVVSWRCCDCSIIREHLLIKLLQLWMLKSRAISGEIYGVPFVGFLIMIELSLSIIWSLIGIGTSVIIVLLMRGRLTRLMLYHKDVYRVEHSLVNMIVLSRADVL